MKSLSGMEAEEVYLKGRKIIQKEEGYLPLSLQYRCLGIEKKSAALEDGECDSIRIRIGQTSLGTYKTAALYGRQVVREFGEKFVEKLAAHTDDFAGVKKGIRKLQKLGVSDDILREVGERFGTDGYGWLLKKRPLGFDNDLLRKLTQADNLMDYSDELPDAVRNSDGHADDIIKAVSTYGDDAADVITKYGDDAADIIAKHGDDGLSWIKKYKKDAIDVIQEYGDEAVDSLKKGMTPDEIWLNKSGNVTIELSQTKIEHVFKNHTVGRMKETILTGQKRK